MFGERKTGSKVFLVWVLISVTSVPSFAEGGGADVLFGLAAIVSAASPAVTAGIQAGADVSIARTNANASVTQSRIASDTSKYQADSLERITMAQNRTAQAINYENNKGQTDRLGMMLAERAAARNQAYTLKQDEMRYEYSLQRQELQMADIQREENYKLAVMQLEAEKVKAGLSTGFTRVNSGLTTIPSGQGRAVAKATVSGIGSQIARAMSGRTRLLGGIARRGLRVGDRLTSFGFLAQGSTRNFRQRGISDLSAFQSSLAPARSLSSVSEEGLYRHRPLEETSGDYGRAIDQPSHR